MNRVKLTYDEYSQFEEERFPFRSTEKTPITDKIKSGGVNPDSIDLYIEHNINEQCLYLSNKS